MVWIPLGYTIFEGFSRIYEWNLPILEQEKFTWDDFHLNRILKTKFTYEWFQKSIDCY